MSIKSREVRKELQIIAHALTRYRTQLRNRWVRDPKAAPPSFILNISISRLEALSRGEAIRRLKGKS